MALPLTTCTECNGTGKLIQLGGDWGKRPDAVVNCWRCEGTGIMVKESNHALLQRTQHNQRRSS